MRVARAFLFGERVHLYNVSAVFSAIDNVSSVASGIGSNVESMGSRIGSAIKAGFATAAVAATLVAGLGVGLAKLSVDAMPLVGVKSAFEGISGAADKTIAKLREGSLGMVRDADLMKSYNQAAQLVSKTFADQLPGAMGYLSKVSAATGQDMGFMIDSLVKGVGRMSPMILDNLGIQVALSDAVARASQMFGKEADDLSKTEKQAGMMAVVMDKLKANTASMPEVAGSAAQGWASLGVTMGNIKDNVGIALVPVLQAVLKPLSSLATEYGPKVTQWATDLAASLTGKAIPGIQNLGGALQEGIALITGAGGDWSAFNELLASVFGQTAADLITRGAEMASGVVPKLSEIGTWLRDNLPSAIQTLSGFWANTLQPAIKVVADFVTSSLIPALKDIGVWVATNLPPALETLSKLWSGTLQPALKDVSEFVSTKLVPAFKDIGTWVIDNLPGALRTLGQKWDELKGALGRAHDFVKDNLHPILIIIGTALAVVGAIIFMAVVPAFVAQAAAAVAAGAATLLALAPIVLPIVAIGVALALLVKAWESDWGGIRTKVTEAWNDHIKPALEGLWTFLTKTLPEGLVAFVTSVRDKFEEIKTGFEEKITAFRQFGSDLVAGLQGGFTAAWEGLKSVFEGLVNLLPAWAKKLLGIASASTVMRALGIEIPRGLAEGIDAGAGEAIAAMVRLVAEIVSKTREIATGLATPLPVTPAGAMGGFLDVLRGFAQEAANWMVGAHGQGIMEFVDWFKRVLTPILSDWVASLQPLQSLIQLARDLTGGLADKLGETKLKVGDMLDQLGLISAAVVTWAAKNESGLRAGIPLLANARGYFESWVASLQPLQSLVQLGRDLTGGLADKLGDTKVTVVAMLDRLASLSHDMAIWEAQNRANLTAGLKVLAQVRPLFESWLASLQPFLSLLQLGKSILDLGAAEVSKVKLSVSAFFDNLLTMSEQAVAAVGINVLRMAGLVGQLQQVNPLLLAFKLALDPLAALLPVVKGVLDVGAVEVALVKLSVPLFFGNLLGMSEAILLYVGQNILYLAGLVGRLQQIKPLLDGLKAGLDPLQPVLSTMKSMLELGAVKVEEVKLSVPLFFENLRQMLILTVAYLTWNEDALWSTINGLARHKALLVAFNAALDPLQPVLGMAKTMLDLGAAKVADVQLSVSLFFENLRQMMIAIVAYLTYNEAPLWSTINGLARHNTLLVALKDALEPLQPVLSMAKSMLEIGSTEVKDMKLSVVAFFDNLLTMLRSIIGYLTDNELLLWAAIFGLGKHKVLLEALKAALEPLQPALSLVKGVLDIGASEVQETKLKVDVFFNALLSIAGNIVTYLTQNAAAIDLAIEGLKGQATRLGNLKTALDPLQPVLSLMQGILKIASEKVLDVKLDVATFFTHLIGFANTVSGYFRDNAAPLDEAIAGLVAQGPRMLALKGALDPLNTVLQAVQNTIKEGESVSEGRLEQTFNQRIIPVIQNVRGCLRGLYDKLVSLEMDFIPDLLDRLGSLRDKFKQALDLVAILLQGGEPTGSMEGKTALIDAFKSALSKGLEDATGYLTSFYNYLAFDFAVKVAAIDLSAAGLAIGTSLANGLLAALPAVVAAAGQLAAAAGGTGGGGSGAGMYGASRGMVLAAVGAGASGKGTREVHLHVGTLVADDNGLRKLETTLRKYREQEDARRSGA